MSSVGGDSTAATSARVGSVQAGAGEVGDRPAEHGVLHRGEVAVQHRAEERGDHLGLAAGELVGSFAAASRPGVERVEPGLPARVELDDREAEGVGEGEVLALGVGDGDPAAEHPDGPVDEELGGGGLPDAGLAGEEHVRVGDQPAW